MTSDGQAQDSLAFALGLGFGLALERERDALQSVGNKSLRVRLSEQPQRCILPFRARAAARMRDVHELGAIGTLIGSATMTNPLASVIAEEVESSLISEFFKHNFGKQEVRIVVLGAPGVGKTSIVEQFVCNRFPQTYRPTTSRRVYHPVVITPHNLFEIKLCDSPAIENFALTPNCRKEPWQKYLGLGLRTASVFLLVYDVTSDDSFAFISRLHDDMQNYFDSLHKEQVQTPEGNAARRVPIVVVGNKADLQQANANANANANGTTPRNGKHKSPSSAFIELETPSWNPLELVLDECAEAARKSTYTRARLLSRKSTSRSICNQLQSTDEQKRVRSRSRLLKKLSSSVNSSSGSGEGYGAIVARNWKALHLECSAKHNWNIGRVFEELLKLVADERCDLGRKNSRKNTIFRHRQTSRCSIS